MADDSEDNIPLNVPLRDAAFRKLVAVGVAGVLLTALLPIVTGVIGKSSTVLLPTQPPRMSAPWHAVAEDSGWRPVLARGANFADAFGDGRQTIYRFVALYPPSTRNSNLVRSNDRIAEEKVWRLNATGKEMLRVHGQESLVTVTHRSRRAPPQGVVVLHSVNGTPEPSAWTAELRQACGIRFQVGARALALLR